MFYILPVISCIILIIIDQFIKYLTVLNFYHGGKLEVIDNFFYLTYTGNPGAAWGILSGARVFFLITTFIVIILIGIYYVKMPRTKNTGLVRLSLILITSGAIGNFIDRLFMEDGKVVDMFHITFWGYYSFPVFNFADVLIVAGVVLLAVLILFCKNLELNIKKENKRKEEENMSD